MLFLFPYSCVKDSCSICRLLLPMINRISFALASTPLEEDTSSFSIDNGDSEEAKAKESGNTGSMGCSMGDSIGLVLHALLVILLIFLFRCPQYLTTASKYKKNH